MEHRLKILQEYFEEVKKGYKLFELRKNDRNFKIGDTLLLEEYNRITDEYTGNSIKVLITYILYGPVFGLLDNWCIMSIKKLNK